MFSHPEYHVKRKIKQNLRRTTHCHIELPIYPKKYAVLILWFWNKTQDSRIKFMTFLNV